MPRPIHLLKDDRADKLRRAEDIPLLAEKDKGRSMTEAECAIFDELVTEIQSLDVEIKTAEEHAKRVGVLTETRNRLQESTRLTAAEKPGSRPTLTDRDRYPATYSRVGRLRAFKGDGAMEKAYRCGMWARAFIFGDDNARRYCLNYGIGPSNALSTTSNPDGGFLVPEEMSQTIIDLREEYGVFRQNTRVVPMGRDTMTIPRRLSGVSIGPVGENPTSAIAQSSPTWNQVRLTAKKAGGLTLMSTEIAEDAVIDLGDWITQEFGYAFALYEDQCGFIGDGTSTYLGIRGLGSLFTTTGGAGGGQLVGAVDAASGHDTFGEIDSADLAKLMAALPAYVMNPKFYCSKAAAEILFGRLAAAAGGNTLETLSNGKVGRSWLGVPIVISQVLPSSQGDLSDLPMLYYGDLSLSSTMGDRRDVRIFQSEHRYMDTDQIGIRGTCRFDIVNHDVGDTTTGVAGPIVALVGD
jgi:HK97 family phage major capsid protein